MDCIRISGLLNETGGSGHHGQSALLIYSFDIDFHDLVSRKLFRFDVIFIDVNTDQ